MIKSETFTLWWAGPMVLALALWLTPAASSQEKTGGKPNPAATRSADQGLSFNVEVTTGSGSTTSAVAAQVAPAPTPPAAGGAAPDLGREVAGAAPLTAAPPPAAERSYDGLTPERRAIFQALDQWQAQNMLNYDYNLSRLSDPFMPIKEVRGKPEDDYEEIDPEKERQLPPILRLELSQLKLVAITVLTGGGSSLASFEDGAGSSYILRRGDQIGRRQGRITRIEPTQVTIEEPPRRSEKEPKVTVMKLNVLDTGDGLTYSDR